MTYLTLMRHADAQPDQSRKNDRGRPLSGQGMKEIDEMNQLFHRTFQDIDAIICSNAKRTRQTLDGFARSLNSRIEPQFDDRLYEASSSMLLEVIRRISPACQHPFILGHNPGLQDFMSAVMAYHQPSFSVGGFHTCSAVTFEVLSESWSDVSLQRLKITQFVTPDV